jgi:soluble lytic murein transglycosylase-like protein
MRALISLFALLAALPAWGGGREANPYRLAVDPGEYRLRVPGGVAADGSRRGAKGHLSELIDRHARARGLDPDLVHAVVRAESAYRPGAVSPKGAVGLMQVMPDTGRRFGVRDLADPEANLEAGTAYLGYLLDLFSDLSLALAAYNAGEGAVMRHGNRIPPYPETRAYVQGILKSYGPGRTSPARRLYLPGTRLDRRDLSPYRLGRDPWRDAPG